MKATRKSICTLTLVLLLFMPSIVVGGDSTFVVQNNTMANKTGRFIDNHDGTVTDTATGLMWIQNGWRKEFLSASTWFEARDKCAKFNYGNYRDWRLPTVNEWRSLINTNFQNPALIEPNPFLNLISHMPYWTQSEYIYGKQYTCSSECPLETYVVMLYFGNVFHQKKTRKGLILPVRTVTYD